MCSNLFLLHDFQEPFGAETSPSVSLLNLPVPQEGMRSYRMGILINSTLHPIPAPFNVQERRRLNTFVGDYVCCGEKCKSFAELLCKECAWISFSINWVNGMRFDFD